MPSTKSPAWDVRIDALAGVEENLRPWCEKHGAILAVKEWADAETANPHFHVALRTPEVSDQTVRNWVKELLPPGAAKTDYSLRRWDGQEKLLNYYCKGPAWYGVKTSKSTNGAPEPPVVIYTTLLEATIKSYHDEFWKNNKEKTAELKDKAKKAAKSEDVVQLAVAHIKAIQANGRHITYEKGSYLAFEYIFDHYKGRIGRYALQNMVQSVLWSFSDQFRQKLKKAMFQQIANGLDMPDTMSSLECSDSAATEAILGKK